MPCRQNAEIVIGTADGKYSNHDANRFFYQGEAVRKIFLKLQSKPILLRYFLNGVVFRI
jgi:hypothetical protein